MLTYFWLRHMFLLSKRNPFPNRYEMINNNRIVQVVNTNIHRKYYLHFNAKNLNGMEASRP